MKKTIQTIITGMLLISMAYAIDLVPEEPYSFDLGQAYSYYEITGNSTEIDLNLSHNGTVITIIPSKYLQEDNFTITFYGGDGIIASIGGGGEHSSGRKFNWSKWNEDISDKPDENKTSVKEETEIKEEKISVPDVKTNDENNLNLIGLIVFIILGLITIFILYKMTRKKEDPDEENNLI